MNLFDYTQTAINDQANAFAKMSDKEAGRAMLYKAGAGIAGGIKGMLGVEDPEMRKASEIQLMAQGLDLTTAKGMKEFAIKLGQKGYNAEGAQAANRADLMDKNELERKKTIAETGKYDAQAEQAKRIKDSQAEATKKRELVSNAESKLEKGETLSPDELAKVRVAFYQLTQPRPILDATTGAIVMTPGLSKEEISPKLAALFAGGATTTNAPVWTGTTNTPEATIAGINSIADPVERKNAMDAFTKAQGGVQASTPKTAQVIETPKSLEIKDKAIKAADMAIFNNQEAQDAIDRAIKGANKYSTGLIGQITSGVGVTPAGELKADIDNIKAKVTIETINEMKQQSKTGATGFGSLAVKELEIVQNAREALNQNLKGPKLVEQLMRLKTSLAKATELLKKHKEELAGQTQSGTSKVDKYMQAYPGYSRQEVEAFLKQNGKL